MTGFVDCKLMLTMSLRCMLLFQMPIFCKCSSPSNFNLSNCQFDWVDLSCDISRKKKYDDTQSLFIRLTIPIFC